MKLAVLGGSFNPLHIGHAMLADTIIKSEGYDKVLFVPTCIPPHKQFSSGISTEHRLGLVKAFCEAEEGGRFEVETCEIERGGVSYTVDTLEYLVEKYKGKLEGKPALLMGEEIAAEFGKWKKSERIVELADLIIFPRKPDYENNHSAYHNSPAGCYKGDFNSFFDKNGFEYSCKYLNETIISVSSTAIRERIAAGRSFKYLVPEPVFEYICENGLYRNH